MLSSGMLRHVALVRTDISEDHIASIIRVTRIGELETTLAVTNIRENLKSYMCFMSYIGNSRVTSNFDSYTIRSWLSKYIILFLTIITSRCHYDDDDCDFSVRSLRPLPVDCEKILVFLNANVRKGGSWILIVECNLFTSFPVLLVFLYLFSYIVTLTGVRISLIL
jgi:hypothetical protein